MDLNNTIQEVVVVEGYHDLARLKHIFPSIDIVITNGSEISMETLNELKQLNQQRGLILFLDPDYQGERIRSKIQNYVGPTKHAFLKKEQCISKNHKKVGIEHASINDIKQALQEVMNSTENTTSNITLKDLRTFRLVGYNDSKQLRKEVTDKLHIGLCNGKSLLSKLHMFNISLETLQSLLKE